MWELCKQGFECEKNRSVIGPFMESFFYYMKDRPEWAVDNLLKKFMWFVEGMSDDIDQEEILRVILNNLLQLWLVYRQEKISFYFEPWFLHPEKHHRKVIHLIELLESSLTQGDPEKPQDDDERIRKQVISIYEEISNRALSKVNQLIKIGEKLNEDESNELRGIFEIFQSVSTNLFVTSGARDNDPLPKQKKKEPPKLAIRIRFLKELGPTMEILAQFGHASIIHDLLQTLEFFIPDDPSRVFSIVTKAILEGGASGGYQYDENGTDLLVKILKLYLADYRDVLNSNEETQLNLLKVLDVFVQAGWPNAQRLIYELPEMLR